MTGSEKYDSGVYLEELKRRKITKEENRENLLEFLDYVFVTDYVAKGLSLNERKHRGLNAILLKSS